MSLQRFGLITCALLAGVNAIDSITVPNVITAGINFTMTVTASENDTDSEFRVYLDTTPPGYAGGQSCYLKNSTSIDTTSLNLTIPANFGPDGDFYSISTREISTDDTSYVYSNGFSLTGATGNWSEYEDHLNGAPLWDANSLPCSSYNCARSCAEDSYPADLTRSSGAYSTMSACIMQCPGVSSITSSSSSSASATSTSSKTGSSGSSASGTAASGTAASGTAASGTAAAAAATSSGAASTNIVPASFVAAGGLMVLFL